MYPVLVGMSFNPNNTSLDKASSEDGWVDATESPHTCSIIITFIKSEAGISEKHINVLGSGNETVICRSDADAE